MQTAIMKKSGWLLGSLLIALCVMATMIAPGKALAASESEPNDSMGAADAIKTNEWVYGRNDGDGAGDYYRFYLPQTATVTFTFASCEIYDTMNTHGMLVYNSYGECVASGNFYQNTTRADTIVPTKLSKGTYYVEIDRFNWGVPYANHPYKFKVAVKYGVASTSISKVSPAKAKFTVKWSKKPGTYQYQVRYSTNPSMSGAKAVNVASSYGSKTIKAKSKKTYYVQVRVGKKIDGKVYWSGWSGKKSVRTK